MNGGKGRDGGNRAVHKERSRFRDESFTFENKRGKKRFDRCQHDCRFAAVKQKRAKDERIGNREIKRRARQMDLQVRAEKHRQQSKYRKTAADFAKRKLIDG